MIRWSRVQLPVVNLADPLERSKRQQVAADLAALEVGHVRFGQHDRGLYATDASLYQVEPLGIVVPATIEQAARVVGYCAANKIPLLPRGGGTSLAGQGVAKDAVVLDLSAFCRRILNVDVADRTCVVEPGITPEELNRQLLSTGLFFAADPATVAQAAIGGCIGNNAAGSHSIRYGRTSENLAGVELLLSTNQRLWLEPGAGRRSEAALLLAERVANIVLGVAGEIRQRFPKTVRRNAGYGLDLILDQLDRGLKPIDLDLSGLICGSEGTLGLVVAARLKLHLLPLGRALAMVSFASVEEAIDAVGPILQTKPSAVELLDDVVLDAARHNTGCRSLVDLLPRAAAGGDPAAVLYVEYQADESLDELERGLARLRDLLPNAAIKTYRDAAAMNQAWTLRKSGEALLHGLASHRKPVTFVEDNAVPIEQLPQFVREFKRIVAAHCTTAAYWAHASVGVLHVRPMLDLHDLADLDRMQSIAQQVAELARNCGGVMSGEHGDGRARGPLLEQFFGPELMGAFRDIKRAFDPANIFNPGNITGAGPIQSITSNLRVQATKSSVAARDKTNTYFDYTDQAGFDEAVERCNGAGFCRKTAGGTMCPSYRATLDERHSTRGRGNALRLAITGQTNNHHGPAWDDPETIATLDLCLSCKACKTECPSNVDMARLKAEYTAQQYRQHGTPLVARLFGHIRKLNQLGAMTPRLSNAIAAVPPVRTLMNRLLRLDPRRSLPPFNPSLYRWFTKRRRPNKFAGTPVSEVLRRARSGAKTRLFGVPQRPACKTSNASLTGSVELNPTRPKVVLYADCFTTYNEPHVGKAAIEVLESLGYEIMLPRIGCCGRAMISTGLLPNAITTANAALDVLAPFIDDKQVRAIIVCEPSCLSAIKDDWLHLKLSHDIGLRHRLAVKAMLPEQFVETDWDRHPSQLDLKNIDVPIILHGHCHQKALWGDDTSAAVLRRLAGQDNVTVLPSGCCGMAGAFGYAADKYDLAMRIGELSVFPPVRSAPVTATIVAPGTSCRHQIKDATGRHAIHPIELITNHSR